MQINLNKRQHLTLKHDSQRRWWLIIPASFAFFASLGVLIFSSFYDWKIAVAFGQFFHHPFGNFLAHWSVYTGSKMVFWGIVPAVMILVETYFLKAKVYKPQGFLTHHSWLLFGLYFLFFSVFISLNIWEIWYQKFGDRGWGQGVIPTFVETYETGLIYRIVLFLWGLIFYSAAGYYIHFRLVKNQQLLQSNYWVASLKIIMFAILIYATVGFMKLAMGRPYYYANIYKYNPDGWSIEEELRAAGFEPTRETWFELPYVNWWEPYRPMTHLHQLITFDFNKYLYNNDFPSGHLASGTIFLSLIFFELEQPKKTWRYRFMIGFSYLMILQLITLYFGMVIYRLHWLSDMAFTMVLIVPYWWLVEVKINFWMQSGFFYKYLPLLSKNDKIIVANYKKTASF